MPIAEAMMPWITIHSTGVRSWRPPSRLLRPRILCGARAERERVPRGRARRRSEAESPRSGGGDGGAAEAARVAKGGRCEPVVTPEGLGELRGLAIADAPRDLAHGQAARREQLGGALHPDGREVL